LKEAAPEDIAVNSPTEESQKTGDEKQSANSEGAHTYF
jgi:hypothetical protein